MVGWWMAGLLACTGIPVAEAVQPTLSHLSWPISGEVRAYFKRPAQDTLVAIGDRWAKNSRYNPLPSLQSRVKGYPDDATLVAVEEAMSYLLARHYGRWGWTPVVYPGDYKRSYQLMQTDREWTYPAAPPVGRSEAIVKLGVPAVGPDGQPLAVCRLLHHAASAVFEIPQSDTKQLADITGHMECLGGDAAAAYWQLRTFP